MQCMETSRLLAEKLNLSENQYKTVFQSRLGRTRWIGPQLQTVLTELSRKGAQNIVVACPSFVADCLETLEEVGIRAKEQWLKEGGKQFTLVPSLNAYPLWIEALNKIVQL